MTRIQITLQPVDTVLDGARLPDLVDLWLAGLADEGVAPVTVDGYANKLLHFTTWWRSAGPGLGWELRKRDLQLFGRWLETVTTAAGAPLAFNTRRDVLRRLQQMLRWAFRTGRLPLDLSLWVPKAAGGTPKRAAPALEDLERLLDAGNQAMHPVKDRAVLGLLIGTGMRRAEVSAMNVGDITFNAATGTAIARVRGKRTTANQTGERTIALDAPTVALLRAYLVRYRLPDDGPLFVWQDGATAKRMGPNAIYRITKRAIRRAGLEDRIRGPHDLRRAFATLMVRYIAEHDTDLAVDVIRRQLGHQSLAMTSFYTKLEPADLAGVMRSPLAIMEAS